MCAGFKAAVWSPAVSKQQT